MRKTPLATLLLITLAGCDPSGSEPSEPSEPSAPEKKTRPESSALSPWYDDRAQQQRQTLKIRARTFLESLQGLLDQPNAQRLATARETWRGLYKGFNQAYVVLRIAARSSPQMKRRLQRTDPVPIFPGYIDGLAQWPDSGIVHDHTVDLTRSSLIEQQGATADGEASLGFQVVHFLLHGEPDHPRTADAFVVLGKVPENRVVPPGWLPEQRRRDYLRVAGKLLTEDLRRLAEARPPTPSAAVVVKTLRQQIQRLIRLEGLAEASAVDGEYMAPATREQAMTVLLDSLRGWLAADTAFMKELARHELKPAQLRKALGQVQGPGDVQALQALHAELAGFSSQLGQASAQK